MDYETFKRLMKNIKKLKMEYIYEYGYGYEYEW